MPNVREASTQVRYYQPEGFEAPGWLKWGLLGAAAWVGYDIYKYHALPGPLASLDKYVGLGTSGTGGSGSGSGSTRSGSGSGGQPSVTLTKAQAQALKLFPHIPHAVKASTGTRYYYAGPYQGMPGYVGIAVYNAAGTLERVFPKKYTAKLSQQIGAVNTGTYKAPGHYTINPAKVG